jgi:NhaP-type Na+/H+ or K+/H+ antiporter
MIGVIESFPIAALSQSRTLFELGLVVVLAAAAPLIARLVRLPSILLLLALGFGAGASGALDPNALLGQHVISAVVSVAVGIILFEAGLGLKLSKQTDAFAPVYRRLVTVGILVTWAVGTVAAHWLFDLSFEVALVLGAVLVVSGPTVVGPLLEFIRPSRPVNVVLKWEGTLADPIGATLGVVVFNAVIAHHAKAAGNDFLQLLLNVGVGVGLGVAGAAVILAWAAWFKPTESQAVSGTLMFVVAAVVSADLLRDDSGLITGLVIGAILVNRSPRGIEPPGMAIQKAKLARSWRERISTLSTFLIGILFIILSARVTPHQIAEIGWVSLAFIAVLVLLARPLAVAICTFGSQLELRERAFIAWMAPRGIVAAATSSTFALGLTDAGVGGAQKLIPITFIVIVATALIYGLTGGPVARALGVASTGPGGVLVIGATKVGRAIGRALQHEGIAVVLWTADDEHARAAEADGLTVHRSDPAETAAETAPSYLDGLEYALAVSGDDALNAMIATDLSEYFGSGHVFQLAIADGPAASFYTRAPVLFDASATHDELLARIEAGAELAGVEPPAGANGETEMRTLLGADGIPIFVVTPEQSLHVLAAADRPPLKPGQRLHRLIRPGGTPADQGGDDAR